MSWDQKGIVVPNAPVILRDLVYVLQNLEDIVRVET